MGRSKTSKTPVEPDEPQEQPVKPRTSGRKPDRQQRRTRIKHLEQELGERVKELRCLYIICKKFEKPEISFEQICREIISLIPQAWNYPDIACARIVLDYQEYQTDGFRETMWRQGRDIRVHGKPAGRIEVCYLEERAEEDEGPFLQEERNLLDAIAERLGRVVERVRTEQTLRESEQRYRVLSELTSDLAYGLRVEAASSNL